MEAVTTQHGEEKTKLASLLHASNHKVLIGKVALRSVESKITTLELQLQMANSHLTQVQKLPANQVGGPKGKGLLLEVGQPSGMQTTEKEASPLDITSELLLDLTEYVLPTSNLEHAYAFDRQVLFLMLNLNRHETLSTFQFGSVWPRACYFNLENLLVEVIVRGDLELEDYGAAYSQIGNFGLRRILYYNKLESDLATRRSTA